MSSSGDGRLRLRPGNLTCSSTAGAVVDIVVDIVVDGVECVAGNVASGRDVDVVVDSKS